MSAGMLVLMRYRRAPVALLAVIVGIVIGQITVFAHRCQNWIRASSATVDFAGLAANHARNRLYGAAPDPAYAYERHNRDRVRHAPDVPKRATSG